MSAASDFAQRSHSQPSTVPRDIIAKNETAQNQGQGRAGTSRKALGKTAHIHEVGMYRRRRVSSKSQAAADNANVVVSASVSGGGDTGDVVRDVFVSSVGVGSPARSRSRSAARELEIGTPRRGSTKGKDPETALGGAPGRSTPVKGGKRPATAQVHNQESEGLTTPSGSDAWEDTSDAGDDGDDEDVSRHDRDMTVTLGPKPNLSEESGYSSDDLPSSTRGGTPLAVPVPLKTGEVRSVAQPHVYPERPLEYI